jgi:hypothetical protein
LQEQEHDDENQGHRLGERHDHFSDRNPNERRGVVGHGPCNVFRERAFQLGHARSNSIGRLKRIRTSSQLNRHARGAAPIQFQIEQIALRA